MIPTKDLPASVGRICKVSQRGEDLQTIIIVLDSTKMNNPDLDICYSLPDRIESLTDGRVRDNGYDYLSGTEIGIWLETEDAEANFEDILELMKSETFLDNDLSKVADVYISTEEKYSLQGTTQGRYLTGGVPPVRFSM